MYRNVQKLCLNFSTITTLDQSTLQPREGRKSYKCFCIRYSSRESNFYK